MRLKSLLLLILISLSAHAHYAAVSIKPYNITAYPNKEFNAKATIQFGIQNNTYETQTYILKYSLCPEYKNCLEGQRTITLASSERISEAFPISMPLRYGFQGGYKLVGFAKIEGESSYSHSETATITVSY